MFAEFVIIFVFVFNYTPNIQNILSYKLSVINFNISLTLKLKKEAN